MNAPILITGGTGRLGRLVVPLLRDAGAGPRILSRRPRPPAEGVEYVAGDLATGRGVAEAVAGARTVLHLAGGAKGDDIAAVNLVAAASEAGVRHFVHISVIAADAVPLAWFRTQAAAERAVTGSGIPWSMLRAAQFTEALHGVIAAMAKSPVVPVPGGLRFQPVATRDVAERMAALASGEPAGRVADLAGPRVYAMGELIRGYLAAHGKRRLLLPVRIPGKAGAAYRAGENLNLDAEVGAGTWEECVGRV